MLVGGAICVSLQYVTDVNVNILWYRTFATGTLSCKNFQLGTKDIVVNVVLKTLKSKTSLNSH